MSEEKELTTLLKEAINKKKKDVKEYTNRLDQNLSSKIDLLDRLKTDINEITKVDINELNEIITTFSISNEEKENMKKELDIVKALLTLNQKEKTSYTLLPNQLATINSFLEHLETYITNANQEKQLIDPEYKHIITVTKQYKELLSKLKNPNSNDLIKDTNTIKELFQESKISEEEKQEILLTIIKYNQQLVDKKQKEKQVETNKLSKEDIEIILKQYGYNFSKLDKKLQEKLEKQATRKNMEEVLSTMQKLEFPKIKEEREGLLLVTYLIATKKKDLEEITKLAQRRGINISNLEKLVSAFIPNSYLGNGKYAIGRMEDFKKNLSLLAERGLDISLISFKQKEILIISNDRLERNLDWLERYGLYSNIREQSLLDGFLAALNSKNIPEIIDLWMESHHLGLQYIKNNLSTLSFYLDNISIPFFKLYQAEKEDYTNAFRLTISNGIKKLSLTKEISKDDIDFKGIHDMESAIKVTGFYHPKFIKETSYERVIIESLVEDISDQIFEKPEIIALNRFSDPKISLLYDINGLRISKLKVLRIYNALYNNDLGNTLESLLYAICYNKIMTEEEYKNLRITIKQVTEMKEV